MPDSSFDHFNYVHVPVSVLVPDPSGIPRYSFLNRTYVEQSGITNSGALGKTAQELFPTRHGDFVFHKQIECVRTGDTVHFKSNWDAGNETSVATAHLEPVKSTSGKVVAIVSTWQPLEADQKCVQQRKRAMAETEQFVALAAHDLRTPMRNIGILSQLLRDNFKDFGDGKIDLIDMLEDVAHKSNALLTDVLDHTLTANARPAVSEFRLGDVCSKHKDVLDPQGFHEITFNDALLTTDRVVFQLTVGNLVDNAIKHGDKTSLRINITVSAIDDETLCFTVADNGRGLADPSKVFRESDTSSATAGYGLMGIKRLIVARDGQISVSSPGLGKGTTMTFTLPGTMQKADHPPIAGKPDLGAVKFS